MGSLLPRSSPEAAVAAVSTTHPLPAITGGVHLFPKPAPVVASDEFDVFGISVAIPPAPVLRTEALAIVIGVTMLYRAGTLGHDRPPSQVGPRPRLLTQRGGT